jgi:hypothetical protein
MRRKQRVAPTTDLTIDVTAARAEVARLRQRVMELEMTILLATAWNAALDDERRQPRPGRRRRR